MISVLLLQAPDRAAPPLAIDLATAGFHVCGQGDCAHLVREALRHAPDVVVCWLPHSEPAFIEAVRTLQAQQSMPLAVFTHDTDVQAMRDAIEAGVHAWEVQGYGAQRLRPVVQLALAREAHQRGLRTELAALGERLEERKLVDKAKGILMRSREISEEEAFALLRTASMHGKQRVGQVSRQVIDAARVGAAINRAGQQRMLSQRLVKLYALACSRTDGAAAALLMRESIERIEDNLAALERELAPATFGDLLQQARGTWLALRRLLEATPAAAQLSRLDELAETVVATADALVQALESSGLASTVGVINVAGRQRMLSQRMAKLALMLPTAADKAPLEKALAATAAAFEEGMRALAQAPLSTEEIRSMLDEGRRAWDALVAAVPTAAKSAGRMQVAASSEDLLGVFDRLTEAYQHSMHVLLG